MGMKRDSVKLAPVQAQSTGEGELGTASILRREWKVTPTVKAEHGAVKGAPAGLANKLESVLLSCSALTQACLPLPRKPGSPWHPLLGQGSELP